MSGAERHGLQMVQFYEEGDFVACIACSMRIGARERHFRLAHPPWKSFSWTGPRPPRGIMRICFPCVRSAGRRVAELDSDEKV